MIRPEGSDVGSGRVSLLHKCIYSLKQSAREWNFRLSNFLKTIAFEMCPKESFLLVEDGFMLPIHFADRLFRSKTKQAYERFLDLLKSQFKIKELERPDTYWVSVCSCANGISGNSELLTFTDSDFASVEKQENADLEPAFSFEPR